MSRSNGTNPELPELPELSEFTDASGVAFPEAGTEAHLQWLFPRGHWVHVPLAGVVTLGRGVDCDEVLTGSEISRRHAELRRDGSVLVVRDLESTNGVYVNGLRYTEAFLKDGDLLRVGDHVGLVRTEVKGDPVRPFGCRKLAEGLIGGARFDGALASARKAAGTDLPVVLLGEPGTGKESIARAIHHWSGRSGRFVAVDCRSLKDDESPGAFLEYRCHGPGLALVDRLGLITLAHRGTLFLDYVGDLSPTMQSRLEALLARKVALLQGGEEPSAVDIRFVASHPSSLRQSVAEGTFLPGLLARLEGLVVKVPPLRQRIEDIPELFQWFFVEHAAGKVPVMSARFVEHLCLYSWPFNVQELLRVAERCAVLHGAESVLRRHHLPDVVARAPRPEPERRTLQPPTQGSPSTQPPSDLPRRERDELDRERLRQALVANSGNLARAASELGMSRQRAYRLLQGVPGFSLGALRGKSRRPPTM